MKSRREARIPPVPSELARVEEGHKANAEGGFEIGSVEGQVCCQETDDGEKDVGGEREAFSGRLVTVNSPATTDGEFHELLIKDCAVESVLNVVVTESFDVTAGCSLSNGGGEVGDPCKQRLELYREGGELVATDKGMKEGDG